MTRHRLWILTTAVVALAAVYGFASGFADYTDQMTYTGGASCQEIQVYARGDPSIRDRATACRTSAVAGGAASGAVVCLIGLIVVTVVYRRTPADPKRDR